MLNQRLEKAQGRAAALQAELERQRQQQQQQEEGAESVALAGARRDLAAAEARAAALVEEKEALQAELDTAKANAKENEGTVATEAQLVEARQRLEEKEAALRQCQGELGKAQAQGQELAGKLTAASEAAAAEQTRLRGELDAARKEVEVSLGLLLRLPTRTSPWSNGSS